MLCSAQIYKVARPTPFFLFIFFFLHMHAIYCMGVHECTVCYYYDIRTYYGHIVIVPQYFSAEAKSDLGTRLGSCPHSHNHSG